MLVEVLQVVDGVEIQPALAAQEDHLALVAEVAQLARSPPPRSPTRFKLCAQLIALRGGLAHEAQIEGRREEAVDQHRDVRHLELVKAQPVARLAGFAISSEMAGIVSTLRISC